MSIHPVTTWALTWQTLMDPWVTQMGYPVVSVKRNGTDKIVLTQERFVTSTDGTSDEGEYGYKWDIPVTIVTSVNPNFNVGKQNLIWFYRSTPEITINVPPTTTWLIVNAQQYGYFRVNYEDEMWMKIIEQLSNDPSVIHPINRAQIINDAWSLAKKGDLNMSIALQTINFLRNDDDYVPWRAITSELTYLDLMLSTTELYGKFQKFMKDLVNDTFLKIENTNITDETPINIFNNNESHPMHATTALSSARSWQPRSSLNTDKTLRTTKLTSTYDTLSTATESVTEPRRTGISLGTVQVYFVLL
ncbi:aminopeptidase N-like [Pomacea canaliculata]|uniref:aminopeptidase N-like n=1 Tax=Pomacea canaliculata TaxID=400727 RepID=UPI000D7264DC|nr:aminopeptidase N-like [Pomacea canaliculata]